MNPQLKAALQEIALSHSQGMYMCNPDGEFVPVNAEALAAQLESELQPEIERLEQQHQNNYQWLLGLGGSFPASEPGARYNWRSELRRRIPKEMLYRINQLTQSKPQKGEL